MNTEIPESVLRDLFAGLVMHALIVSDTADDVPRPLDIAAASAYRIADALLAERAKRKDSHD